MKKVLKIIAVILAIPLVLWLMLLTLSLTHATPVPQNKPIEDLCPAPKVVINERCQDQPVTPPQDPSTDVTSTTTTPVAQPKNEVFYGK